MRTGADRCKQNATDAPRCYTAPVLRLLVAIACLAACGPSSRGASPSRHTDGPTVAVVERSADLDGEILGPLDPAQIGTIAMVFASWCEHCRNELPVLAQFRDKHPTVRIVGVNYRGHEEYDGRGDAAAVRQFVVERAPWLRVVPADEALWTSLGRPARVPTIYVFDRAGVLLRTFDRDDAPPPSLEQLEEAMPGLDILPE